MLSSNARTLIATLAYSDIFDYPLTKEELWKNLIDEKSLTKKDYEALLKNLPSKIVKREQYYCFFDRKNIITMRKTREKISSQKMLRARKIADVLSLIPSVKLLGLSGAVAANNAKEDDDIDFFVVTQKKTLWTTRLLLLVVLQLLGVRRVRKSQKSKDTACLNMLLDENALVLPQKNRDIYVAHEIVQLVPLLERDKCYERFFTVNNWIKNYLPNAKMKKSKIVVSRNGLLSSLIKIVFLHDLVEAFARWFQLWYMQDKVTHETITNSLLAFHPIDYRSQTLDAFRMRVKRYYEEV